MFFVIEKFEDDFKQAWKKAHPGEKTPQQRSYELHKKTFEEGFMDYMGKKIPCTKIVPLSDEDKELEKKLRAELNDYRFQKEMYVAERVYAEIGWEEFRRTLDNSYFKNELKMMFNYFTACASADAQCSFECPVYEVCKGNVEEKQKCKETINKLGN